MKITLELHVNATETGVEVLKAIGTISTKPNVSIVEFPSMSKRKLYKFTENDIGIELRISDNNCITICSRDADKIIPIYYHIVDEESYKYFEFMETFSMAECHIVKVGLNKPTILKFEYDDNKLKLA